MDKLLLFSKEFVANRKILFEVLDDQQRLCRTTSVFRVEDGGVFLRHHFLISMAERTPSANKLKAIDVKKMNAPGSAAIKGLL